MKKFTINDLLRESAKRIEKFVAEDNVEDDDIFGDGLVYVFELNDDLFVEKYVALMPDGMPFFITWNGGVGTYVDGAYGYSTQNEMEEEFDAKEIFVFPPEVIKRLKLIASNYYDEPKDKETRDDIFRYTRKTKI